MREANQTEHTKGGKVTEIEKMTLESKDLVAERIEQLKTLFPEIIAEGEGAIDFEKLR